MNSVRDFICDYLQQEYTIDESIDLDSFNYVETGYIDSMGIIRFIATIEDEFNIEFDNEEITNNSFKIVGKLIKLIENKIKDNK